MMGWKIVVMRAAVDKRRDSRMSAIVVLWLNGNSNEHIQHTPTTHTTTLYKSQRSHTQ